MLRSTQNTIFSTPSSRSARTAFSKSRFGTRSPDFSSFRRVNPGNTPNDRSSPTRGSAMLRRRRLSRRTSNSVDTRDDRRDGHLRSPDFLDAEKYPTIEFRGRRVETVGGERYRVVGDLTIRGVTRPVELDLTYDGQATDPWGGVRAGFEARTVIRRADFGLTWNQALETGGMLVGDDVKIQLHVEAVRQ